MKHKLFLTFTQTRFVGARKHCDGLRPGEYGMWCTVNIPDSIFSKPPIPEINVVVPESAVRRYEEPVVEVEIQAPEATQDSEGAK